MRLQLQPFRPRLLDSLAGYDRRRALADIGAGVTVGIVALPLAMAFAIASGLKPEAGLITAIVAGFLISALGGSSVQIGGPAGAFIVVVYGIVERYGLASLLVCTFLAGLLLFALGWLRLGALVRYIPVSIVIGFTNGIAVLIALSQLKDFLGLRVDKLPADFFSQIGALIEHLDTLNPTALAIALACLGILAVWPKSYQMPASHSPRSLWQRLSRAAAHLPGTVVALAAATAATVLLDLQVPTIGSRFGGIPQALPAMSLPELSWITAKQLLTPTLTIAMLAAIESLLCARVADGLSRLPRHDPNQELMAQGLANMASPLFGGMPATGTIARTVTNVRSGATSPVAGMVHAVTLLAIVSVAAPLALHVPLAALAGILMFVAWNMGEWREFARARQFNATYRTILFGTFALTVVMDLTVAVEVGLVLACIFFIWRMGQLFSVNERPDEALPPGIQAFELYGSLFFGAVGQIEALSQRVRPGTSGVVLDLHRLVSLDTTGVEALRQLHQELRQRGIRLSMARANPQPASLLRRSGLELEIGAAAPIVRDSVPDPLQDPALSSPRGPGQSR